MSLVNHNGEILQADAPLIGINNRSFRYGDGLFETMRVVDGNVSLLNRHIQRLMNGVEVLRMDVSPDQDEGFWSSQIRSLCRENKCEERARIRLTIYRNSGGYYTPDGSGFGYLIEAEKNDTIFSDLEADRLKLGVFEEIKKPINPLGGIKSANSLIYVMAGIAKVEQKMDDMILLNEAGRVAEVISSNIYIVSNGVVRTPSLSEGCVAGVTRDWILEKAKAAGIEIQETTLELEEVRGADEVFVSNAIQGIRRVSRFGGVEYQDAVARQLCAFRPELD